MLRKIQEAAEFLLKKMPFPPRIGLITGTGLGDLTKKVEVHLRIPYQEIPHFPISTIMGHKGTLAIGRLGKQTVMAMEGRFHLYEGYSPEEVTFPVRVMARLGAEFLIISSAAGGLNPLFEPADVMVVTDHINLTGRNPLLGPNLESCGPRFPDMSQAYDPALIALAARKALELGILLKQGVYAGILGPSLETPAETRFLRMAGADAVGMSTVIEVIAAIHCGLRALAIVAISNVNIPDRMKKISIEEVIATAGKAGAKLAPLIEEIISSL
ncbi:MAG: purine nucleoside phosphorylase inosine and guanosine-specific [Deltaproteobacteria bacterium]|nr:purine nucleoside phosphorylase inosine and guanosine-specific [Deltaproteobacteria bacterium]